MSKVIAKAGELSHGQNDPVSTDIMTLYAMVNRQSRGGFRLNHEGPAYVYSVHGYEKLEGVSGGAGLAWGAWEASNITVWINQQSIPVNTNATNRRRVRFKYAETALHELFHIAGKNLYGHEIMDASATFFEPGHTFDQAMKTLHTAETLVMKIENLIVLLLTVITPLFQNSMGWRGILPLRSTRTDVEREFGPLDLECQCYKTEHEIIHVVYATGPCVGDLPGWNVPRDTVLSLTITPYKEVAFSEVEARKDDFVKTLDDTFTAYYGNRDKGVRYSVSAAGFIKSISYVPSVNDNSRRCIGFPLTDGGITAYSPYDEFAYDSLEDITSRLGEFTIRLQKERGYKGYIVVYAGSNQKIVGVSSFANKARDYLIKKLKTDPNTIVSMNGGYREQPVVQLFLLPSSWPPPVANPTLPGTLK